MQIKQQMQIMYQKEMSEARARIDEYLTPALELASAAIETDEQDDSLVVAGEASLLNQTSPEDLHKVRELFDAFEKKRELDLFNLKVL